MQDIISYAEWKCSGRQSCEFTVSSILAAGIRPCNRDVMSYLEASYKCIPGTYKLHVLCVMYTS